MLVKFWGTRGAMAKPGPTTLQYGGNTSCVEVRAADGTLIVLDCGTGAHGLGQQLLATGERPMKGHLLISHTHWDHIQGLPFFLPLFVKGNEWDIYGPAGLSSKLEATLSGQMEYEYFPVKMTALGATIRFHDLIEGQFEAGGVKVTSRYMNHPGMSMGYRLEADGGAVVYATDHEPHSRHHALPGETVEDSGAVHREDDGHMKFLYCADLVIHDSQYTQDEYAAKIGWGHSPAERVVDWAIHSRVRKLALFHHDPLRDDRSLTALVNRMKRRVEEAGAQVEVRAAAEGESIEVSDARDEVAIPAGTEPRSSKVPVAAPPPEKPPTIVVADDDPDMQEAIQGALTPQGYRLVVCSNGLEAIEQARQHFPDLMLIDWQMPGADGIGVCRELRASSDFRLRAVPIVFLTSMVTADQTATAFSAGATDFLTKPFSPSHLRSKVQQWLMRTRQARLRWGEAP